MFDIGWGELLLIGVVALIAIGPKELPGVLRSVGHWMGKIRSMASEFQNQFHEAMREAEVADFAKQVDELNQAARDMTTQFDPMDYVPKETSPSANAETLPNTSAADAAAAPDAPAGDAAAAAPAVPASDAAAAAPAVESAPAPVPAADSLPPVEREEVTPAPGAKGGRPA